MSDDRRGAVPRKRDNGRRENGGNLWSRAWAWLCLTWNLGWIRVHHALSMGKARLQQTLAWLGQISGKSWTWLHHIGSVSWAWLGENSAQLKTLFDLAQLAAIVAVVFGLWLIHHQLQQTQAQVRLVVGQTQAVTAQETAKANRELMMQVWDDAKLRPILDPSTKNTDSKKVDGFIFILLQHYATAFRQWQQGGMSQDAWEELAMTARQFFKSSEIKKRWPQTRNLYKKDFQEFVEKNSQ